MTILSNDLIQCNDVHLVEIYSIYVGTPSASQDDNDPIPCNDVHLVEVDPVWVPSSVSHPV